MAEEAGQPLHVGDTYSEEAAREVVRRLRFETGYYSRCWEISSAHLDAEAHQFLAELADIATPEAMLFIAFRVPYSPAIGVKLISTPWTDQNLEHAEGITAEGHAKGAAETAILMAPVDAQIKLAEKIGADQGYQNYLLGIRNIEAAQAVGMAQAEALKSADVKVISNAGSPGKGLTGVMDLFSADGGTAIASMLEGLAQSPEGKKMLEKFAHKSDSKPDTTK